MSNTIFKITRLVINKLVPGYPAFNGLKTYGGVNCV